MSETTQSLVTVQLLGLPLDVAALAQEHSDGVMREFSLIAGGAPSDAVPHRLLRLAERLQEQFGDYTTGYETTMDEARARGDHTVDVAIEVPAAARDAAVELGAMLAEADDYCRSGDLLSLVPPADVLAFREWYLEQFIRQIDGERAEPWTDYQRRRGRVSG